MFKPSVEAHIAPCSHPSTQSELGKPTISNRLRVKL